jgi:hypothetical protein
MEVAPEKIELTREEYEKLLASAPRQTITVDAAEYAALVAGQGDVKKIAQERDRYCGRCRELEACLKREQAEHKEELDAALLHIRKLKGHA